MLTKVSDAKGKNKFDNKIKLYRQSIFGDRYNELKPILSNNKQRLREDLAKEYHTTDENVQNFILATQNFGEDIDDSH